MEALVDTNAMTPLVYVSGLMGTERACLGVIAPLAVHPEYKSDIICADLSREPTSIDDAREIKRAYSPRATNLLHPVIGRDS